MKGRTDAITATPQRPEPLSFAVALGHRLRQVREANGKTAAQVAARSKYLGLSWDRSTVAKIELGQRQVTAAELLLMTHLYGVPASDLLPTEDVRFNEAVTASPAGLTGALTTKPGRGTWHFDGLAEAVQQALERLRPGMEATQKRLPGADFFTIAEAAGHVKDEVTAKAARRLGATAEEVATAAQQLWGRGVAEERDARVEAMGPVETARARQARRGHTTRALLDELAPQVLVVRTGEES